MSPLRKTSRGDLHPSMKIKVLTDRCNSYSKGQVIELDPNRGEVATRQNYSALFTMVKNGEAEIVKEKAVKKIKK
jgi:hypothetical protein